MFNVLANFSEKDLTDMLKNVYDSMNKGDVFIPTFFQKEDSYDQHFTHKIFGSIPFPYISLALYDNPETKDWLISSFCNRYKLHKEQVMIDVRWNNDGRDFVEVDILVSPEAILHVPQSH